MVERDLGSTYLMPQSKLYKPDNRVIKKNNKISIFYNNKLINHCIILQGSDTSNFDSL